MATLVKKRNKYYSKLYIRVGQNNLRKYKSKYVNLDTTKHSFAKKRNQIVSNRENEIRDDIRLGHSTKSDLLNINSNTEWSWAKANGTATSEKLITIIDYVDRFIRYKKIKKMRESTIQSYKYALKRFTNSVGGNHLVSDINQDSIDEFTEDLHMANLSLSSIDSNLKHIMAFLNWCKVRNYIESLPIIELVRPVLEDKWLTEKEYNQIVGYDKYSDSRFPKMFKLYAETGMRLCEGFYGVLTEDENGIWLAIPNEVSKSKKGRTIQLNKEQSETIRLIQNVWLENGGSINHIKYYSRTFRKVCNRLGIKENKSFHSLRHYFGKVMVTITGNIYKVSGLMGHSSVKVTEDNYTKGFDRKSTLRDFPSLRKYLIESKNDQKVGEHTPISIPQAINNLN